MRARTRRAGRCAGDGGGRTGARPGADACRGRRGGARRQHFASRLPRPRARRADGSGRARRDPANSRRSYGRRGRRRRRGPLGDEERVTGKAKVVITDYVWESLDVEREILGERVDLVALKTKTPDEFLVAARDCDALLNTYAGPITAEVMPGMPRRRIIARYGIGVDTIDLDAATQAGIIVTNNPTYCIEEVAEQTMALVLASARKIPFYDRMVRASRWEVPPGKPIYRLAGRTLGLVGFGNIARQVAVRAAAFGMRILYSDPFVKEGQFDAPGKKAEVDEILRESDFVSLHPPLSAETRGMMND